MIVGVGGKCCAGKDTVAEILKESGYDEISVDALGHEALLARKDDVVARFGRELLLNGTIDRKALGRRVFSDARERRVLESIVHPEMKRLLQNEIEDRRCLAGGEIRLIINAALIFYMELHIHCDIVLWVRASCFRRYLRARRRDDLSTVDILRRFWTQRHLGPYSYPESVDTHIVKNEGARERLQARLESIGLLET